MTDDDRRQERDPSGAGTRGQPEHDPAPGDPDDAPASERTGSRQGASAADGGAGPDDEEPETGAGRSDTGAETDGAEDERDGPAGEAGWSGAISEMQNLVGDVVGEVLEGVRGAAGRRFPRVDMVRRPDGDYVVLVDLPGVGRDQVKVTTLGGELTVAGERPRPELDEGSEVLRTERGYGGFRRTLRLPPDIREEDVSARLEDGVLEVRLPRKAPSDARTVDID